MNTVQNITYPIMNQQLGATAVQPVTLDHVNSSESAYSRHAREYIDKLGSITVTHPSDQELIRSWSTGIDGEVLDAGCGPGQWTEFMVRQGVLARGIDVVPEFITSARRRFPQVSFHRGSMDRLDSESGSLGGVLSWYSLIHHCPERFSETLAEFARVLRPGGGLLLAFFAGDAVESFDHAISPAYRWPVQSVIQAVEAAGFSVYETHTRTGEGYRPHAAILAWRAPEGG